ncbi:MAG TPA: hypothetical protein VKY27_11725 [Bacteriovoracaceae bacterium]|nr:hypothetical protein [Bacteriovoracaceae bacterium]
MSKSNFLNFLVDETFRIQESSLQFCDLERKLKDFSIAFLRGEFIPQIQMLRFETPMGVLDVPITWSCFDLEQGEDYKWINTSNDQESLLKVMKKSWNPELKSLLIMQAQGYCYLIGLKECDEFYLKDLVNPQEIFIKAA